jgi:hypothetical protein
VLWGYLWHSKRWKRNGKENANMPYISDTPETKSVNARYIRVAAIDIEIIQGNWNICIENTCKAGKHPVMGTQELTMLQATDISRGMKTDQQPFS